MSETPLEREVRSWSEFRRSLSRADRDSFDALMEKVLSHEGTGSNYGRVNPFEAMAMLALIELVKDRRRPGS
jgi:hypothetical protein